jgi:molybdopterin-guanine dinucleotide biosynthesis protein A
LLATGSRRHARERVDNRFAAVILAGGASSRMGRPKAWLEVAGVPLLRRIVDHAREVAPRVVVVGAPGQDLPPLHDDVLRLDDPPDRVHEGPLSGLSVALEVLRTSADLAYVGSCDAPFVTPEHIRFVLQTLHDGPFAAVVPETGPDANGRRILHGLAGAVRVPEAFRTAQALLASGRLALHLLYEALPCRRLALHELPDARAIRDCNSPEDWQRALAELES